jgi:glycosyltransferase involved in cell wall biosynthesis
MRVAFNGRFLAANISGVQRVALELILSIDAGIRAGSFAFYEHPVVICPKNSAYLPNMSEIVEYRAGFFESQLWEQIDLPRLADGKLLINLCNLAPMRRNCGVVMMHDAQVYISPSSYSLPFRTWYQFALPVIAKNAAHILTVSNYSKKMLDKYGVAPADEISVVYNGVDHMDRYSANFSVVERLNLTKKAYILSCASVVTHKNIAILFEAFRREELAGVTLVLMGSLSSAELAASGLAPPGNVVFTGWVTDAEMRGLMEAAVCFACPSTTEGFGLPPLEAMYVGCPAVVAPCGALPEVCGDAAIYADAADPTAWVRAFEELIDDPGARAIAAARGRSRAVKFTWAAAARMLYEVSRRDLQN